MTLRELSNVLDSSEIIMIVNDEREVNIGEAVGCVLNLGFITDSILDKYGDCKVTKVCRSETDIDKCDNNDSLICIYIKYCERNDTWKANRNEFIWNNCRMISIEIPADKVRHHKVCLTEGEYVRIVSDYYRQGYNNAMIPLMALLDEYCGKCCQQKNK